MDSQLFFLLIKSIFLYFQSRNGYSIHVYIYNQNVHFSHPFSIINYPQEHISSEMSSATLGLCYSTSIPYKYPVRYYASIPGEVFSLGYFLS